MAALRVAPDLAMTRHEERFASAVAEPFAVGFRYGRTALAIALDALGSERGPGVALAPLTCKVVPLALSAAGLRPTFRDIDESTLNLDGSSPDSWDDCGSVLFQHTYGIGAGLDRVLNKARASGLPVVEDCAQVLPGHRQGPEGGGAGVARVYSNNLGKPMPAGSGAMLATADHALTEIAIERRGTMSPAAFRERLTLLIHRWGHVFLTPRTYWPIYEAYRLLGGNYKERPLADQIASQVVRVAGPPTASQDRLGRAWLDRLPELARHRTLCVTGYMERLAGSSAVEVPEAAAPGPLYYMPVLTPNKREVLESARKSRVEIIPWPGSTPIYPVESWTECATLGYEQGMCPRAEAVAERLVGLPTHPRVRPSDMDRVVDVLTSVGA